MAYIEPTGKMWLCKDVPLNPSYEDTMTWNSIDEQRNYFISKTKWSSVKYTPIKERQGVLRVNGSVNKFYDCNYLMFENDNFYNPEYNWGEEKYNLLAPKKLFFAFITNVEYVNPETTLIHFQLDVMQTWWFEIEWERSLIEREHVKDDSLYANLEPENITVNERIPYSNDFNLSTEIGERILIAGFTENPNLIEGATGGILGDINIPYSPYTNYPEIVKENSIRYSYTIDKIAAMSGVNLASASYDNSTSSFYVDATIKSFTFYLNVTAFNNVTLFYSKNYYITAGIREGTQNEWFFNGYEVNQEDLPEEELVEVKYDWRKNAPNIDLSTTNVSDYYIIPATGTKWKAEYKILGFGSSSTFYVPEDFTTFTFRLDTTELRQEIINNKTSIVKHNVTYVITADKIDNAWVYTLIGSEERE